METPIVVDEDKEEIRTQIVTTETPIVIDEDKEEIGTPIVIREDHEETIVIDDKNETNETNRKVQKVYAVYFGKLFRIE